MDQSYSTDAWLDDARVLDTIRETLFYVVPRISPDGADEVLHRGRYVRSSPVDDRVARHHAHWVTEDIDGDGMALTMRRSLAAPAWWCCRRSTPKPVRRRWHWWRRAIPTLLPSLAMRWNTCRCAPAMTPPSCSHVCAWAIARR